MKKFFVLCTMLFFAADLFAQEMGKITFGNFGTHNKAFLRPVFFSNLKEYNADGTLIHEKSNLSPRMSATLEYFYDQHGNETAFFVDGSEKVSTVYSYDQNGNIRHKASTFNESGEIDIEVWYEYDEKGNLLHKKKSNGLEETYSYDEESRLTYSSKIDFDNETLEHFFEYDGSGRLVKRTDISCGVTLIWEWAYDANGNLLEEKNTGGYSRKFEYRPDGTLKTLELTRNSGTTEHVEYDENEKPVLIQDNWGPIRRFIYDENGSLVYEEDMAYGRIPETQQYYYDANGKLRYEILEMPNYPYQIFETWHFYTYSDQGKIIQETEFSWISSRY